MQNEFSRVVDPLATPEDAVESLLDLTVEAVLIKMPKLPETLSVFPKCIVESMASQRAIFAEMLAGMAAVLYEDVGQQQYVTYNGVKIYPSRLYDHKTFWKAMIQEQRAVQPPVLAYRERREIEKGNAVSLRIRIEDQRMYWRTRLLAELDDDAKRMLCFLKNTRGLDKRG